MTYRTLFLALSRYGHRNPLLLSVQDGDFQKKGGSNVDPRVLSSLISHKETPPQKKDPSFWEPPPPPPPGASPGPSLNNSRWVHFLQAL